MYKRYFFNIDTTNVYIVGDIHGCFNTLVYNLKRLCLTDCVIIIAGDCGFGFEKEIYYVETYNKFKNFLEEKNIQIIFIRGNHDDPEYFDGVKISFNKFQCVPDYSVLSFNDNNNILCIGGGISIDRTIRIQRDLKTGKKSYWKNEIPVYNSFVLNKIKDDGILISTIVSHTSPNFAPLFDKSGIQYYLIRDVDLLKDVNYERDTLTEVYNHLVIKDLHPVKEWVYGHFHMHTEFYSEEGVKFTMLNMADSGNGSIDIKQLKIDKHEID